MQDLLTAGDNCWRIEKAARAAFLIDGETYFSTLRETLLGARHCIFIVGWDVHSELELVRGGCDDGYPARLRELLDALAARTPGLNIYVLAWDFAMIYALEREFFPRYKLRWKTHDRFHFSLDGEHPVGASHHQKLVVVDDRVAFCGGLDLSKWRWDTREHAIDDDRRRDPDGEPYPPFHDVQMVVDGDAAAALGELARERWQNAGCDEPVAAKPDGLDDPWPDVIDTSFRDLDIAIARTQAASDTRDEVREVEQLYLDSIAAAEGFIYVENQYLTSHSVGEALAGRLESADGPEVLIVMPEETGGWLEQHTMDVLRARLLQKLEAADLHDRLRVYYPQLSEASPVSLMVHAKIMVIDDLFVRVGSSNLSNRSMGLDSECDLAASCVGQKEHSSAIRGFRHSLLGEHLGVKPEDIAAAEQSHDRLIDAVESLAGGERTLRRLRVELSDNVDQLVPDAALIDPEKPVDPEQLLDYLVGSEQRQAGGGRLLWLGVLVVAVIGLAVAWRWTPLSEWLDMDRLLAAVGWMEQSRFTPLLVIGGFVLGGFMVFPLTLMIFATVVVFGPWAGLAYSLVGAELSAVLTFAAGHWLGRDMVSRFVGSQINSVSRALAGRGLLTVATLRIVPVAPFTVINVIAGVSKISFRDFALGSFIGLLPGVIGIAFLADRVSASLEAPSLRSVLYLAGAVAAVAALLLGLRHFLGQRRAGQGD